MVPYGNKKGHFKKLQKIEEADCLQKHSTLQKRKL